MPILAGLKPTFRWSVMYFSVANNIPTTSKARGKWRKRNPLWPLPKPNDFLSVLFLICLFIVSHCYLYPCQAIASIMSISEFDAFVRSSTYEGGDNDLYVRTLEFIQIDTKDSASGILVES